jgi:arylsulfatase A-like enzyme
LLALGAALSSTSGARAADKPRLNVLFIAVDDLRPQLGCYGDPVVQSPHIDRLAARGLVFNRAYCQQAVCSPSRSSLLTGRRPDSTRVWDLNTHFRAALPEVVTLPQHFRSHGYHTQSFGKIYHGGFDDPPSWSAPPGGPKAPRFGPEGQTLMRRLREEALAKGLDLTKRVNQPRGLPYEAPDVADNALSDGSIADQAIQALNGFKGQPFFLAVGFLNPHLPFVAPKKYWDLYSPGKTPLATNPFPPKDAPSYALHNSGELRAYNQIPAQGPLSREQARMMTRGYFAAISYMDAQVGRLLDELDRLKLRDNTVVVLWGDHGWQLEEHGLWCKHTNYETSVRVPLIISVPGQKSSGKRTDALTELVDLYPTLAEACGLPLPAGLEGSSFLPVLNAPDRPWKRAAFSQYPRSAPGVGRVMGYSMRTDRYRLVEWSAPGKDFREYELYDHQADPDENINRAKSSEHAAILRELRAQLQAGWMGARPSQ